MLDDTFSWAIEAFFCLSLGMTVLLAVFFVCEYVADFLAQKRDRRDYGREKDI